MGDLRYWSEKDEDEKPEDYRAMVKVTFDFYLPKTSALLAERALIWALRHWLGKRLDSKDTVAYKMLEQLGDGDRPNTAKFSPPIDPVTWAILPIPEAEKAPVRALDELHEKLAAEDNERWVKAWMTEEIAEAYEVDIVRAHGRTARWVDLIDGLEEYMRTDEGREYSEAMAAADSSGDLVQPDQSVEEENSVKVVPGEETVATAQARSLVAAIAELYDIELDKSGSDDVGESDADKYFAGFFVR